MKELRIGFLVLLSTALLFSTKIYPALGMSDSHSRQGLQDGAMYSFHSSQQIGDPIPEDACLVCHPVQQPESLQLALASMGIGCSDCHPGMTAMDKSKQIQGLEMLSCESCHTGEMLSLDPETVISLSFFVPFRSGFTKNLQGILE